MVDIAKLAIEVDSTQAASAAKNFDSMSQSSGRAERAVKSSGDASAASSYKYRMAAMQLSQVASQGSVTGNYLQALAIQLPDLALGFGTLGIVIGSVAGALAVPLFNALGATDESISDLSDTIDVLSESMEKADSGVYVLSDGLRELESVSRSAARLRIAIDANAALSTLDQISEGVAGTVEDVLEGFLPIANLNELLRGSTLDASSFEKFRFQAGLAAGEVTNLVEALRAADGSTDPTDYEALSAVVLDLKNKYGDANDEVNELAESMAEQIPAAIRAAQVYERLNSILDGTADKTNDAATAMQLGINASAKSLADIEELERTFLDGQQQLTDERLAQIYTINNALEQGVINQEEFNALRLASDQAYTIAAIQLESQRAQAISNAHGQTLSSMQNFAQNANAALEAYGREGSRLGKVMLLASKGLMVAQAIMAAEMSAVMTRLAYAQAATFAGPGAPGVLAAGEVAAQVNRTLGYASAALIAATEFGPGRELGGQVKAGQSYMVGERGPEMITMGTDGHITANKNLNGGTPKVEIINNGQPVSAEATMDGDTLKIILDAAEDRINSNIAAGRSTARIMQSAYGLRRAGR